MQDVVVVNCYKDFMASNHVLATCRTALKKQGIVGLNIAPCMRAFLERLPVMLQEQYTYEKVQTGFMFLLLNKYAHYWVTFTVFVRALCIMHTLKLIYFQ